MQKSIIGYIIIFLLGVITSAGVTKIVFDKSYNEIEGRYNTLVETNRIISEQNKQLIENNNTIRRELDNSNGFIRTAKDIIREFEAGIRDTKDILGRIEETISAIESIIRALPE